MKKIPISLIIDDSTPIISMPYELAVFLKRPMTTAGGIDLTPTNPNSMLLEFCDVIERNGIKGKFSIVPMPANKGDIVRGLDGVEQSDVEAWLDTVKSRVIPAFSTGPEMLTHTAAVDLVTGETLGREDEWAKTQDRTTLTPYIAKALSILKEAEVRSVGVTSPWSFAKEVEEEYIHAISDAVKQVNGSNEAWYFLHMFIDTPNIKPWVALDEYGRTVVSIPSNTHDVFWHTTNSTDTSEEYISALSDRLITADGKEGELLRVLETGGWPVILTHWQCLVSNGLNTGLRVLDEVGKRVSAHLSDRVEWMSFEEIMNIVVNDKSSYPRPKF